MNLQNVKNKIKAMLTSRIFKIFMILFIVTIIIVARRLMFRNKIVKRLENQVIIYSTPRSLLCEGDYVEIDGNYVKLNENDNYSENSFGNYVEIPSSDYSIINKEGRMEIVAKESMHNEEYIGSTQPYVTDNGIYYTSYSISRDTNCIIKKYGDTIEFVVDVDCEDIMGLRKIVKNDILYYAYDNVIYSYNLLNGERKLIADDSDCFGEYYANLSGAWFDVNDNGDVLYVRTDENNYIASSIIKNDGEIINLDVIAYIFLDEDEVLCEKGNIELGKYNIDNGQYSKIAKFYTGDIHGKYGGIIQMVLNNNKDIVLVEVKLAYEHISTSDYVVVDINSGRKHTVITSSSYSRYISWADKDMIDLKGLN